MINAGFASTFKSEQKDLSSKFVKKVNNEIVHKTASMTYKKTHSVKDSL